MSRASSIMPFSVEDAARDEEEVEASQVEPMLATCIVQNLGLSSPAQLAIVDYFSMCFASAGHRADFFQVDEQCRLSLVNFVYALKVNAPVGQIRGLVKHAQIFRRVQLIRQRRPLIKIAQKKDVSTHLPTSTRSFVSASMSLLRNTWSETHGLLEVIW